MTRLLAALGFGALLVAGVMVWATPVSRDVVLADLAIAVLGMGTWYGVMVAEEGAGDHG